MDVQASQNNESTKSACFCFLLFLRFISGLFPIRILYRIFNWEPVAFFAPKGKGAINSLAIDFYGRANSDMSLVFLLFLLILAYYLCLVLKRQFSHV